MKDRIFFRSFGCKERKTKRNSKFAPSSPFFLTFHLKSLLSLSLSPNQVYSWISSSDTAAGVSTPKSVNSSEMNLGGV